jgi:pilus assembly protein Flp/PilA
MDKFTSFAGSLLTDESGTTAIEYGLMAALIGLAIVVAVGQTSDSVIAIFDYWSKAVTDALKSVL